MVHYYLVPLHPDQKEESHQHTDSNDAIKK